jgi:hypothetical protein
MINPIGYIIISAFLFSCSLGPNPNPGERTVDRLIAKKEYKKAIYNNLENLKSQLKKN